jgi:hypothetical protein
MIIEETWEGDLDLEVFKGLESVSLMCRFLSNPRPTPHEVRTSASVS